MASPIRTIRTTVAERWRTPAIVWAVASLLLQSTSLQNRSFEPDEGLRVYCARQLLHGETPYRDFWDHKDPTEWFLGAGLLALFGDTLMGLRLGVHILRAILIYQLVAFAHQARIPGRLWLVGGLSLALLSAETTQGHTAAMEIPALLLFLLAMRLTVTAVIAPSVRRYAWLLAAGVCAGLGILIKATTALACFIPLLILPAIRTRTSGLASKTRLVKDTAVLTAGLLLPGTVMALWCAVNGIFEDWLFIHTVYNPAYSQGIPHTEYLAGVLPSRIRFLLPFAVLAILGLLRKETKQNPIQIWVGIWLVCAGLSVCLGWRFYPHYFLLLAPPLALLGAGAFTTQVPSEKMASFRNAATFVISLFVALAGADVVKWYILEAPRWEPPKIGFFTDQSIVDLASHIRETTTPDETIYVLGYCPDILVLAERRSASRFSFKLPLAAEHSPIREEAQREVLESLRTAPPRYIVVMKHDWTPQHPLDSDRFVQDWNDLSSFLIEKYELVDSEYLFDLYRLHPETK